MMHRNAVLAFLGLGAVALVAAASAPQKVTVLHFGKSAVNTETVHFLEKRLKASGLPYEIDPVTDPKSIQPGSKAIVVLNTGLPDGTGRKVADFLQSWPQKSRLILVTLRKDSKDLQVRSLPPSPATFGVDAVSAASAWESRGISSLFGGKNSAEYDMHQEWIRRILALIDTRH